MFTKFKNDMFYIKTFKTLGLNISVDNNTNHRRIIIQNAEIKKKDMADDIPLSNASVN